MLVPSNVVRMFARTSFLVVATGLFHGLFILPCICRSFASNHLVIARNLEPLTMMTAATTQKALVALDGDDDNDDDDGDDESEATHDDNHNVADVKSAAAHIAPLDGHQ